MKVKVLSTESKLLGGNVLRLFDWKNSTEIIALNDWLIDKYDPLYVFCEMEATDISSIHQLEKAGYHFSENRIKSSLQTEEADISSGAFYPMKAEIISEKKHLAAAIRMLTDSEDDDRFSKDPRIGKPFSKERVIYNLNKSFRSYPKEFLLGIFNDYSEELLAFRSGAILSQTEAHLYQYGVSNKHDFNHTSDIMEALTIDFLKQKEIKIIHAVSTGFNTNELNRLISLHGFTIHSSSVLMRKVFETRTDVVT